VFTQDGQIYGFVEKNLSFRRKNGVKSEIFATCLFEDKICCHFISIPTFIIIDILV